MRLLQFVAILVYSSAFCQEGPRALGIGFVAASNPYKYENGTHFVDFFMDKTLKTKATASYYKKVEPYMCKPDYGLYHFICLSKSDKSYEILINNSISGYITNDENFYFVSWESHLMNKVVERLKKDNPIFTEPSAQSKVLEYSCNPERLKVEEVIEKNNEYWISVSFLTSCEDINETKTGWSRGWIKWRSKNELLINIFLLC